MPSVNQRVCLRQSRLTESHRASYSRPYAKIASDAGPMVFWRDLQAYEVFRGLEASVRVQVSTGFGFLDFDALDAY